MSGMEDFKARKKKYGKTMQPIPATRAYKKEMAFDHKTVDTQSFILINDNPTPGHPKGSRTHVNLYNGETGAGYDAVGATHDLGDEKTLKRKLRDYEPCDLSECPVAVPVPLLVPAAPPAVPAVPISPSQEESSIQEEPQGEGDLEGDNPQPEEGEQEEESAD